jgi:hypothetical protein
MGTTTTVNAILFREKGIYGHLGRIWILSEGSKSDVSDFQLIYFAKHLIMAQLYM